ncbi:ABC transporter permease [Yinghuangia sp. ASG 101]|uniref:ABC transporter permease n=1 Tax=Yinghuangia sp. ASG 101 TaxID=2896848 RepID=UPI001E3403ED|nr:ABC transporter permease [Yinghuangia sp. ASG 101]UGQ12198.1 ABC transporter permease [Yinghuangia sp. ASG 101]
MRIRTTPEIRARVRETWRRNPLAGSTQGRVGLVLAAAVALFALLGPLLADQPPDAIHLGAKLTGPSPEHWLGTDQFGRDQLARLADATRRSVLAALTVLAGSCTVSLVVGVTAGLARGVVDAVLMRVVDIVLAIPSLVLALAVVGLLGPGFGNLLLALVVSSWAANARLVRAFTLGVRDRPYIAAARLAGAGPLRVATGHILPAVVPQLVTVATLQLGGTVVALAGLSFLGLGAQPPAAELGAMLGDARAFAATAPWLLAAPATVVLAVTAAANLIGDALRDAGHDAAAGGSR